MTTEVQAPVLKRKKNLSPIWILPILAAVLGLWLLVNYIQERGSDITVQFPSATGIEANKTMVRYQGIIVGQVIKVQLARDSSSVDVQIRMQNSVDDLLREQTHFWLVSPKASLTGIDGLDALFSGNYIAMQPGEGARKTHFVGDETAPALSVHSDGLVIHIAAPERGSLNIGSGIFFQQVKIGQIVDFTLQDDGSGVVFDALITPEHQFLVRQDSRFWNVSGAKVDANRSGVKLQIESLATLLAGGIAVSSPSDSVAAVAEQQFTLFADEADASPKVRVRFSADSADGLGVGSSIRYRGIELGQIDDVILTDGGVELSGWVDARHRPLLTTGSQFNRVGASIGLDGISNLDTVVFGDFIRLWPGTGEPSQQFTLLAQPPEQASHGRYFTLSQSILHGVSIGAPLRYRGVVVGEVLAVELTSSGVDIKIFIERQHQHLVRTNSRFWLQGAVAVKADFSALTIKAAPMLDALSGGIAFSSSSARDEAPAGQRFTLADDKAQALQAKPQTLQLTTDSLVGLNPGAPVFYRDLETGKIESIKLVDQQLQVTVSINDQYRYLIGPSMRFWHYSGVEVKGSLAGLTVRTNPLVSMIRGGLSFGHLDQPLQAGALVDNTIYPSQSEALDASQSVRLTLVADGRIDSNTAIRYLGHQIGNVTAVELSEDLRQQTIQAELKEPWAKQFLRRDAQYYLVQPKVALSGIRNVQTILSGNYIAALPGQEHSKQSQFTVATEEPLQLPYGDGLRLVLTQSRLGSLHIGSPVLYRQIRVGEVIHTRLTDQGEAVDIEIQLMPRYQHLVNASSKFWNASGVDIDFGVFSGADIKTESLETILAGGVAFATQHATNSSNRLSSGQSLQLYGEVRPGWLAWQAKL
ncbi:MlaD family protein [uncultured Ferrimonas sp.]|uniref:MlaD family protein n=1 Tax=uncultured Ferrimonas sp. TaxID=432640 RepID=UPI00262A211D|nr:MlaD family protein [uncultured Ferrimonas sp.]